MLKAEGMSRDFRGFVRKTRALPGADDGVGLNFNQNLRRYKRADLNHRCRRANIAKELSVGTANLLPFRDVGDIHPGTHDVVHAGACFLQSALNIPQALHRLGIHIVDPDDLAVWSCGRCTGYMNIVSDLNGPGISDYRFPSSTAREVLALHSVFLR